MAGELSPGDMIAVVAVGVAGAGQVVGWTASAMRDRRRAAAEAAKKATADADEHAILTAVAATLKDLGAVVERQNEAFRKHELECAASRARLEESHAALVSAQAALTNAQESTQRSLQNWVLRLAPGAAEEIDGADARRSARKVR